MICPFCLLPRPVDEPVCSICGDESAPLPASGVGDAGDLILSRDVRAAYAHLESRVASGGETAEICRRLAWLALSFEDIRAVETWSHESLRLEPESAQPHLLLGLVLGGEARYAEAVAEYDLALRSDLPEAVRGRVLALRAEAAAHVPEW